MSDFGVERDMNRAAVMDQKIESLLSATADAADPLVAELALMRQSLTEAFPVPTIPDHVKDSHVSRMMEAVVPVAAFAGSNVAADRTTPLETLKASFSRRVVAVTLALSTAFGGAAYAGVLPDPVQRAVAKAASVVGLNLPGGEEDVPVKDESGRSRGVDDDGRGIAPGLDGSEDDAADEVEDRRDDERDARQDAEDDARDDAEDRRDDEADRREDEADDARDAREDAEDEAEDRRDEAEDRRKDAAEEREDAAEDEREALEEAEDAAEDEAEESREELEDADEERRDETSDIDEDELDAEDSEREGDAEATKT